MIVSVFDQLQIENRLCGWIFDVLNQVASEKHPNLKQNKRTKKTHPDNPRTFCISWFVDSPALEVTNFI